MPKVFRFPELEKARKSAGVTQWEMSAAAGKKPNPNWYAAIQSYRIDPAWTDMLALAAKVNIPVRLLRTHKSMGPVTVAEVEEARKNLAEAAPKKGRPHHSGQKAPPRKLGAVLPYLPIPLALLFIGSCDLAWLVS